MFLTLPAKNHSRTPEWSLRCLGRLLWALLKQHPGYANHWKIALPSHTRGRKPSCIQPERHRPYIFSIGGLTQSAFNFKHNRCYCISNLVLEISYCYLCVLAVRSRISYLCDMWEWSKVTSNSKLKQDKCQLKQTRERELKSFATSDSTASAQVQDSFAEITSGNRKQSLTISNTDTNDFSIAGSASGNTISFNECHTRSYNNTVMLSSSWQIPLGVQWGMGFLQFPLLFLAHGEKQKWIPNGADWSNGMFIVSTLLIFSKMPSLSGS